MITAETIEAIKDRVKIADVIGEHVKLKKEGSNLVGLCPFHNEKTPSFSVSSQKGIYKCFGCGKSGDVFSFVIERGKTFIEAVDYLAAKCNMEINHTTPKEYVKPVGRLEKLSAKTISYFENARKISNNTLLRFNVTESVEWMPKAKTEVPAINFNYSIDGELINIKFRAKDKDFKLFGGAKLVFYNLDSIKESDWCVITEGEIDALTWHECGIYPVVSVPNGAGAGKQNLEYLDNCYEHFVPLKKIIIATDGDFAGDGLRQELARRLGMDRCYKVEYPADKVVKDSKTGEMRACKDANEVLCHFGKEAVKKMYDNVKEWPIQGVLTFDDFEADILRYYDEGFPEGVAMGIPGLDELIKFQEGQYTFITGIPGMGKSEFLDYLLSQAVVRHHWRIGLVSFENQPAALHATKILQKLTGLCFRHRVNPAHRMSRLDLVRGIEVAKNHYFFVNLDEVEVTIDGILEKLGELVVRKGLNAFVIDPWNYIEQNRPNGMNETDWVSQTLSKIGRFCRRTLTHGFIIAHPTKMPKEGGKFQIPNLYSISGSAHFYNKTDNGICVHTDEVTNVYVQKVRFDWNGEKGYCQFQFNTFTRQYTPIDKPPTLKPIQHSNDPPPQRLPSGFRPIAELDPGFDASELF